jgi:hypothetical protein
MVHKNMTNISDIEGTIDDSAARDFEDDFM